MRIPVLTYHAANIAGVRYADNDHVALAADLRLIDAMGWHIVSLDQVVDRLDGVTPPSDRPCLALSFDDGTDFDVRALDFPGHGLQPGFLPTLQAFAAEVGEHQPDLHATCFVIASPAARAVMDRECLFSGNVMNEDWWHGAEASDLLAIGNHSWDHNHEVAPEPAADEMPRGSFHAVDNAVRAHWQIARAQAYIAERIRPQRPAHFAYPYGHVPAFLAERWLPEHGPALGLRAAWGTQGRAVAATDSRWALPRFVCGLHWRSPDQLRDLLMDARADDTN